MCPGMNVAAGRASPMKKAKVLVVDDAMLIRRIVTDVLAAEPAIEVVGEAGNGRIALQKIAQLAPDPVTLDRKSTRLNSSHLVMSYAVSCLKKESAQPAGSYTLTGSGNT